MSGAVSLGRNDKAVVHMRVGSRDCDTQGFNLFTNILKQPVASREPSDKEYRLMSVGVSLPVPSLTSCERVCVP